MLKVIAPLLLFALAGCVPEPTWPENQTDQKLRIERFEFCLKTIPPGPSTTTYNDWDDVVATCDAIALAQAQVCVARCPVLPVKEEPQQ